MKKNPIFAAVIFSLFLLPSTSFADDNGKYKPAVFFGGLVGAAKWCKIENTEALVKIIEKVNTMYMDKNDRIISTYLFSDAALNVYISMDSGSGVLTCEKVETTLKDEIYPW